MSKLWGGRFEQEPDKLAEIFNASISFDSRLLAQDILGSIAHAAMLGRQGVVPQEDADKIVAGLKSILDDAAEGKIHFSEEDEDIHMNVERLLTARIGEVGKRLHTGRSRNDQVALDMRLYMLGAIDSTIDEIIDLCEALIKIAEKNLNTIIPAYTHLQKAQPSTLAHYMMAYCEMFRRDILRFMDCSIRTDSMPLGSGALCATTYPLDRDFVAEELGFSGITPNSLDAVSDRDFLIEYLSSASICMMHLSRFCEELILWSTGEFGVLSISDAYSTGSSIMPQKKNPDMAELIRGKTGRVYGALMGLLTVMKGLPLAYNKDMQEDKEGVFDTIDTLSICLHLFTKMIKTATFNKEKLYQSAGRGFTNATDAADYLVKKGMPFRDAHEVIGKIVLYCEKNGLAIADLPHLQLKEFSELFDEDVYDSISLEACVQARNIPGGPAPESVKKHIREMKKFLKTFK
jgi:argininosuccinate lyase